MFHFKISLARGLCYYKEAKHFDCNIQVTPVLTNEGRALQMTPVNSKDDRALPGVSISSKTVGPCRQPTVLQ